MGFLIFALGQYQPALRLHMAGPPSSGPGFVPRNEHIFMADHYMITID